MSKVRCKGVDLEVAATNSELRPGISQVSYVHVVINGDQIGFDGIGDTVQVSTVAKVDSDVGTHSLPRYLHRGQFY